MRDLTFPVTVDSFAAWQAANMERELTDNERSAIAAWVPLFNDAYQDGIAHDTGAVKHTLNLLDEQIGQCVGRRFVCRFLEGCKLWVVYAWERGTEQNKDKPPAW